MAIDILEYVPYQWNKTRLYDRRHDEWIRYRYRWSKRYDAYEGGERYANAQYGVDSEGVAIRNLVRHKREYPSSFDPIPSLASGAQGYATNSDYELRRAGTPVPSFTRQTIRQHQSKIYEQEIDREGPPEYLKWCEDVDGRNTTCDDWMKETVAPLLAALGCVDLVFDRPRVPPGEQLNTRADEIRLNLDRVIGACILPQYVLWWDTDDFGRYNEVLIYECGKGTLMYWTPEFWQRFDPFGKEIDPKTPHAYGRVPIVRVFDTRLPSETHVGDCRYEPIMELSKQFYNKDSESVLSDANHAHPLFQGPEDYVNEDNQVLVGPSWMVAMKKSTGPGGQATYQGFEAVAFPTEGMDSLRENKKLIRDEVDRAGLLTKPAGAAGTSGSTVAQTGIAKRLDQKDGNAMLTELSNIFAKVERTIAEFVLFVQKNGADVSGLVKQVKVNYPQAFDLYTPEEMAKMLSDFQDLLSNSGSVPILEVAALSTMTRMILPGLDKDVYAEMDKELKDEVERRAKMKEQAAIIQEEMGGNTDGNAGGNPPGNPQDGNPGIVANGQTKISANLARANA